VTISIVVSTCITDDTLRATVVTQSFSLSEWFSLIGFVCIGLDMNLLRLVNDFRAGGWKLVTLYLIGQSMDLCSTFGWAYLVFN